MLYPANMLRLYHASKQILYHAGKQAAGLPCASAADEASVRVLCECPSQSEVENAKMAVLQHSLPKARAARQRTNVSTKNHVPRGSLFGGFTTRGEGITNATFRYLDVVSAIHILAATRPKGFTAESTSVHS